MAFPTHMVAFNQRLMGYFGQFGTGAGSQIFFVQSALNPADLDRISLISDIPGAEAWPVRDLFQREVDNERVTTSLVPYLLDAHKLKFFNPLTLTLLPFDVQSNELLVEMPKITETTLREQDLEWICLELKDYYRFRYPKDHPEWGVIEWNDTKVRVVAIDGQHRLSALKRIKDDITAEPGSSDFFSWNIPVVLFSTRALTGKAQHERVLDVVRNIFVYINTEAKIPSESRQILLSDERVNDICTQELLEYAHSNDVKPAESRVAGRVPLLFFDWRGVEYHSGKEAESPAAVKTIKEIREWLRVYVLGENFAPAQEIALSVTPQDALKEDFNEKKLSPENARELRAVFKKRVLPGLGHLIENFTPYKQYIEALRLLEDEYCKKSDIARHAFHKLRFGDSRASLALAPAIRDLELEIIQDLMTRRGKCFSGWVLEADIGMRAVVSAYGAMKPKLQEFRDRDDGWLKYSKWYTKHLNSVWTSGLIKESDKPNWRLLKHICYDHTDGVCNYRLDDVPAALGAYLQILVGAAALKARDLAKPTYEARFEDLKEVLLDTLFRGYKREVRPELKEQFPQGGKPLNEAVNKAAERKAENHLDKIEERVRSFLA